MSVLVSVPTAGSIRAETVAWLMQSGLPAHIQHDRRPLMHQRNAQVKFFLSTEFSHLFLLDADCIPQPGTVERLLSHDLPLVGAPGRVFKFGAPWLMALDRAANGEYVQHTPQRGLQRVDAIGCAGMLIRRDVLEGLEKPWFRFRYDEEGLLVRGEDLDFCERVLEMPGGEVWADMDIPLRHIQEIVL